MYGHNLVGVYGSTAVAERVRDQLIAAGFTAADIRMSGATAASTETLRDTGENTGFWAWLFGDVSDTDRDVYAASLRENRVAVSVRVANDQRHAQALDIMEGFDPIDLGDRAGPDLVRVGATGQTTGAASMQRAEQGEQVIPVVKEELAVGKKQSERRYRVRTHIIEKPVEEQVTLRDERVEIEHRPISGTAAGRATMPQERDIDIVERHEEPVVEKRGRATEEVVVRKEVTERPETVRGTVQETKVEVEKEPATTTTGPTATPRR